MSTEELQQAHQTAVAADAEARKLQHRMMETQTSLIRRQRESAETAAGIRSESVEALLANKEPNVGKFAQMETKRRLVDDALGEIGRRIRENQVAILDREADERAAFSDWQQMLSNEEEKRALAGIGQVWDELGGEGCVEFHDTAFQKRRSGAAEASLVAVHLRERAQRERDQHRAAEA